MKLIASVSALLVVLLSAVYAGESPDAAMSKSVVEMDFSPYQKGHFEFDSLFGLFCSVTGSPDAHPAFNYELNDIRFGYMLTNIKYSGFFRGNYELLLEASGGPVTQGPGSYLVGGAFQWRYNFIQNPSQRIVPYGQFGFGGAYSDAHANHKQVELGSAGEFNEQVSIGSHFFVTKRLAIDAELGFRHLSNAGLTSRNTGVNTLGGLLGVSYFY